MLSSVVLLVVSVASLIIGGSAQSQTNATCLSTFGWANNSLDQSPCLVSAYLQGACHSGQFFMPALAPGQHYAGPTLQNVNPCQCSTVLYSVVSACGACQNYTYDTWSGWSANCSSVYVEAFPDNIPSGTAVPAWAYLDVTISDGFDAAAAQRDASAPESTGTTIPTATISTSTSRSTTSSSTTSSSSLSSSSPSPSTATKSSKSSSHTGAIAGGVVGGIVGLALLSAFAFWYRRRPGPGLPSRPTPATYGAFDASEPSVGPASQQRIFSPTPTLPSSTSSPPRVYMSQRDSSGPIPMPGSPVTTDMYTTYSAYQGSMADHHTSPEARSEPAEAPEM